MSLTRDEFIILRDAIKTGSLRKETVAKVLLDFDTRLTRIEDALGMR